MQRKNILSFGFQLFKTNTKAAKKVYKHGHNQLIFSVEAKLL